MDEQSEKLVNEWLDEQRTKHTRTLYTRNIRYFVEWLARAHGKTLADFLAFEPKEMRHFALAFQSAMANKQATNKKGEALNHKISQNTIATMTTALSSFCQTHCKPLLIRGKRQRIQMDSDSHTFTNGDLIHMFEVGNTEEKAILAIATSLGWEVSSILNLRSAYIRSLIEKAKADGEAFIYFQNQRQKTGALRLGILNPLAIEWLEKWLANWKGEALFSITTEEGINRMIQRLAAQSQIKTIGRIHSHLIRKWVMSGLSRSGFNDFQIKYVMGKKIPASDFTYLKTLEQEVMERYPKAFETYLTLKPQKVAIVTAPSKEQGEQIASLQALVKEQGDLIRQLMAQMKAKQ